MLKINRSTEYALISIHYMNYKGQKESETLVMTTAREVSEKFGLPFEITAKILQRLKNIGFIQSHQGVQGGYVLAQDLSSVSLGEFLRLLEGEQGVVECCHKGENSVLHDCSYRSRCSIQSFMHGVNAQVTELLSRITLAELMISPLVAQPGLATVLDETLEKGNVSHA